MAQDRRANIDTYLAAHPEAAQRVSAYREQNTQLHGLFDPVMDEPIPERLSAAVAPPTVAAPRRWPLLRLAAAVAWMALGGLLGWNLRELPSPATAPSNAPNTAAYAHTFARGAALAHATFVPEKRHPVEVAADQEAHRVQWLSNRLGKALHGPVLTEHGYALIGGRLLPGDTGPAAQFMYEDPRGGRLTLYLKTATTSSDTAFRFAEEGGISVFYWLNGEFGYALPGTLDKPRLLEIAKAVYGQVNH